MEGERKKKKDEWCTKKGTSRRRCRRLIGGGVLVLVFVHYLVEPIKGAAQHQALKALCSANAVIICSGSAPVPLTTAGPNVEECARLFVATTFFRQGA